jgi:hypothetical protein
MRFPKPRTLAAEAAGAVAGAEQSYAYLPHETWLSWQRKDVTPKVLEWLSDLNNHLEALGRPFGHRMSQAISAYVANHPRSRSNPQIAMADQLEMRIFPKLRGVATENDNRTSLEGLARFIDTQLRDQQLLEAFNRAVDQSDLFLWRGVDRG